MVIPIGHAPRKSRQGGWFAVDLAIALSLLVLVMIPLGYSFLSEQKLARAYYHRTIANEMVDGEMEILLAGEWHRFAEGSQVYPVSNGAATNLPPGQFLLTRTGKHLRLEWRPAGHDQSGHLAREANAR